MTDWIEPRNFRDWLHRATGLRPLLVVFCILAVGILELRFDWMERALGAYLVTTNDQRPESGTIWEKNRQVQTARKTLEKLVTERLNTQRTARNAASLSGIAAGLAAGQGVMLSPDHFRLLYLRLPRDLAREILSPLELLRLHAGGRWRRCYFEKNDGGLDVYLLDGHNRVLRQLEIPSTLINRLQQEEPDRVQSLDDLPSFRHRIYPVERFFSVLESFPQEVSRSMIPHPELLLQIPGKIVRVGISDEAVEGFIRIGFEIKTGNRQRVVLVKGHEWAVWRLRARLEGLEPLSSGQVALPANVSGIDELQR